jgi:sporulation protein YpjB
MLAGILAGLLAAVPTAAWGSPSGFSRQATVVIYSPMADTSSSLMAYEQFLSSAEALYDSVNRGRIDDVRRGLIETERTFRSLPMKEIATVEGIHALTHDLTELKRAVAAVSPDEQKWKSGAAVLRMAADALAHPNKPIWHQYRDVINNDIDKLKQSILQESTVSVPVPQSAVDAFRQLSERYHLIRTAALLKSEPWIIERSDSVIRYASRILGADHPDAEWLHGLISPLQEAMDGLFPGNKEAASTVVPVVATPPWGWTAMMGSFIVTILTWVGWRRYRAEEYIGARKPIRREEIEDAAQRWLKRWKK